MHSKFEIKFKFNKIEFKIEIIIFCAIDKINKNDLII